MAQHIQLRRGTAADLPSGGTIEGEPRFTTDTGLLYIDDGVHNILIGGTESYYFSDALLQYGNGDTFTDATITAALTDIGTTNKTTLLLRSGTWVFDENIDYSAYTNVTFKLVPGAVISHGSYTLNIPNIEAGNYQILSGTGAVTLSNISEINPDWFGDTEVAKIQKAINCALATTPHIPVVFKRQYDITGLGAITLNKTADYGDRNILWLVGKGGGIKKTDSGFVFQGATALVGDIDVSGMRFEGENSGGAILWDGNSIIRVSSHNNEYVDWDTIAKQDDIVTSSNILQSYRFIEEHIVGGRGDALSWVKATDTTISDCLVENRDSFIVNGEYTGADANYNQNHNVRISNNVIEGLVYGSGIAIQLGSTWGCSIFKNYFESNIVYIDLDTKQTTSSHHGLVVDNNVFYLTAAQKAANYQPVIVGDLRTLSTTDLKVYTNEFRGNTSDGELYNFTGTGILYSVGDYAYQQTGFANKNIIIASGTNVVTTAASTAVKRSGIASTFTLTHTESNVTAGEVRACSVAFTDAELSDPVIYTNMVQVYPANISSINVLGVIPVYASATSGTIYFTIENRSESTVETATFYIVVFKLGVL